MVQVAMFFYTYLQLVIHWNGTEVCVKPTSIPLVTFSIPCWLNLHYEKGHRNHRGPIPCLFYVFPALPFGNVGNTCSYRSF